MNCHNICQSRASLFFFVSAGLKGSLVFGCAQRREKCREKKGDESRGITDYIIQLSAFLICALTETHFASTSTSWRLELDVPKVTFLR